MSVTIEPTAAPSAADAAIPDVPIYRLSVAQYEAMARAGILTEDDPVELLEGWLVQKLAKNRPYGGRRARKIRRRTSLPGLHQPFLSPAGRPASTRQRSMATFSAGSRAS